MKFFIPYIRKGFSFRGLRLLTPHQSIATGPHQRPSMAPGPPLSGFLIFPFPSLRQCWTFHSLLSSMSVINKKVCVPAHCVPCSTSMFPSFWTSYCRLEIDFHSLPAPLLCVKRDNGPTNKHTLIDGDWTHTWKCIQTCVLCTPVNASRQGNFDSIQLHDSSTHVSTNKEEKFCGLQARLAVNCSECLANCFLHVYRMLVWKQC